MHRLLTTLLAILFVLPSMCQTSTDSIAPGTGVKAGELIMPLSLVGAGTLGFVEPVRNARYEVRDYLNEWRGDHRVTLDDHLQYIPLASVYGLSLLGVEAKHNYVDRTLELGISCVALGTIVGGLKYTIREERPDGSDLRSFPSGHTAKAFMGAELVRIEYGDLSPWISVGAYTAAIAVGALRIYNEQHWFTDVLAGAGIGILSARIGYWMLPYTRKVMHKITGYDSFVYPTVTPEGATLGFAMRF